MQTKRDPPSPEPSPKQPKLDPQGTPNGGLIRTGDKWLLRYQMIYPCRKRPRVEHKEYIFDDLNMARAWKEILIYDVLEGFNILEQMYDEVEEADQIVEAKKDIVRFWDECTDDILEVICSDGYIDNPVFITIEPWKPRIYSNLPGFPKKRSPYGENKDFDIARKYLNEQQLSALEVQTPE